MPEAGMPLGVALPDVAVAVLPAEALTTVVGVVWVICDVEGLCLVGVMSLQGSDLGLF